MGWLELLGDWAVNIILGLVTAIIVGLCVLVWKEAPPSGSIGKRLWVAAKSAPWLAGIAGFVIFVTLALTLIRLIVPAVSPGGPVASTSPEPRSTSAAITKPNDAELANPLTEVDLSPAGWGPDRHIVSASAKPAAAMLNSMFDNPEYGDERNFVLVKPSDGDDGTYANEVAIAPGKSYTVRVFFHNDAGPDFLGEAALDTRLRVQAPATATGAARVYAFLESSNTLPTGVWDGVKLVAPTAGESFAIRYVPGSATIDSPRLPEKLALRNAIYDDGTLIGCDGLDGVLHSATDCWGFVTFEIWIDQPNFEVTAQARVRGSGYSFASSVAVEDGDVVEVAVKYKNVGTTLQNDIVLRAHLPAGMRYVAGSTEVANNASNFEFTRTRSDGVIAEGINLGDYAPGGAVYVRYAVVIENLEAAFDATPWLEVDRLAEVATNNGRKSAALILVAPNL